MAKGKAKGKSLGGIKLPEIPVVAQFTMDGLILTVLERNKMCVKILSWKDLYKLGKKGKKMAPTEALKEMTGKLDDIITQRAADDARRQATFEELKQKYGSIKVPSAPMAPVMPVPQYRPAPAKAIPVHDPMGDMFKDVPKAPTPPSAASGN